MSKGGNKTGPKAGGDVAVAERRARVAVLMRRGWSKSDIARHYRLTASQIGADWEAILTEIKDRMVKHAGVVKEMMIEELHEVKREAWEEWERSKQPTSKEVTTTVEDASNVAVPDGIDPALFSGMGQVKVTRSTTTEGRIGDARLLKIVKECIDSEAELHGLKTKDATPSNVVNWHVLVNGLPQEVPDDIEAEIMSVSEKPQIGLKEIPPQPPEV